MVMLTMVVQSCTTLDVKKHVNHGINQLATIEEFQPSKVLLRVLRWAEEVPQQEMIQHCQTCHPDR